MTLLQRVLPCILFLTVLLLLDFELLHCGQIAVLLVLLVHLALSRTTPTSLLLLVSEQLLLKGGQVDLLDPRGNVILLLLLSLPAGGLQIDEIEIGRVLAAGEGSLGHPRRRLQFFPRRGCHHLLLLALFLLEVRSNHLPQLLLAKGGYYEVIYDGSG